MPNAYLYSCIRQLNTSERTIPSQLTFSPAPRITEEYISIIDDLYLFGVFQVSDANGKVVLLQRHLIDGLRLNSSWTRIREL